MLSETYLSLLLLGATGFAMGGVMLAQSRFHDLLLGGFVLLAALGARIGSNAQSWTQGAPKLGNAPGIMALTVTGLAVICLLSYGTGRYLTPNWTDSRERLVAAGGIALTTYALAFILVWWAEHIFRVNA